jgi:hypothetical protein
MGVIEPALVAPTFARPAEMIGGKHFGRTASFCLEREKSVIGWLKIRSASPRSGSSGLMPWTFSPSGNAKE